MTPIGSSSFTVPDRPPLRRAGREAGPVVVWLRGEHDLSTDGELCATLVRAIAVDSAGLVLDLSEVEFMAVSTLGVIVRARELLRQRSRSLTVRSPSACVRRVMGACRLNDLLEPDPEMGGDEQRTALGTWVAVPASQPGDGQTTPSPRAPEHVSVRATRAIDLRARAVSVEGLAESG